MCCAITGKPKKNTHLSQCPLGNITATFTTSQSHRSLHCSMNKWVRTHTHIIPCDINQCWTLQRMNPDPYPHTHTVSYNSALSSVWWRLHILKTLSLTLLVHVGLFWCFHNPPNSNKDFRIFNVHDVIFSIFAGVCRWGFCWVCTEFDSGETPGWAQSLVHRSHPSIWWPCSIMFSRVNALALCL